jgi:predicted nucleotidyltransferase component of viral defense system
MRTLDQLQRAAAETGFPADGLEKVLNLLGLLDGFRSHPYLRSRLARKGGTALNLFEFDVPRLSVDIDLNYIGAADRETMLAERPEVERAIEAVCGRQDRTVKRVPAEHAGGKWRLGYLRAAGGSGTLELDLNFVLRVPLWPVQVRASRVLAGESAHAVPVLDVHELIGGKLAALFGRSAARDVFDAHGLLGRQDLDPDRLRLAFVAYGAMNRRDWRSVSVNEVGLDTTDAERMLLPLLRAGVGPRRDEATAWASRLTSETRERLAAVLPFRANEREFLDGLLDHGEVRPGLLTDDEPLRQRLAAHPGLLWKAQNVRAHRSTR